MQPASFRSHLSHKTNVLATAFLHNQCHRLKARAEYLAANYRYKKGEIFKRMRASTLAQLIIEAAEATVDLDLDGLDEAATFAAQSAASQPPVATSPEMPEVQPRRLLRHRQVLRRLGRPVPGWRWS